MYNYILNLSNRHSLAIRNITKIIFLCGVVFDEENKKDKRIVLKEYLHKDKENFAVILEEHFSDASVYGDIDLTNLYDVETLVACFADATIIIHESISTAAELGMLAANKSTASKLLILHPDRDSVEENKISSFIDLAYYVGKKPILSRDSAVVFNPILRRSYETNDRYVYHTSFPNDLSLPSRARNKIDSFLKKPNIQPITSLVFKETQYNKPSTHEPNIIDYHRNNNEIDLYVSPMAMRYLLFSLLSIKNVQGLIEESNSVSEVVSTLQKELEMLLLETFKARLGVDAGNLEISIKGLELSTFQDLTTTEYRKTVGLFVYLLKAMGYLSVEDGTKFKITRSFSSLKDDLKETITPAKESSFARYIQRAEL